VRKRGRGAFRATAALKRKVEELASVGMSQRLISRAIGCDEKTLGKHFAVEIETGLAKKKAEAIHALYRAMRGRKPSIAATKALLEKIQLVEAEEAAKESNAPPAKGPKQGKKQQAAEAATVAGEGSDWGDDLQVPGPGTTVN